MKPLAHFKRLGLQKRIMLYATAGLVVMFGGFAFLGLQSIQRATQLVYEERLTIAHTTAGIFGRDFLHVARDVKEASEGLLAGDKQPRDAAAAKLLAHLANTDPFPFFQATGIWVLSSQGGLLAQAGTPEATSDNGTYGIIESMTGAPEGEFLVLSAFGKLVAGGPFGIIVTKIANESGSVTDLVAVHVVAVDSLLPYVPAPYSSDEPAGLSATNGTGNARAEYHLEVVNPEGVTIMGLGEDEHPGDISRHFSVIQGLMTERKAMTLLHEAAPGETFEPHVMAVVPLPSSPFYIALEQSVDVALALPIELRRWLFLLTSSGFMSTLIVAWITTRHVVKPTEELTVAALRMAQGDLESPISVSAQDEVDDLAGSLDTMRQRLLAAYQHIENANKGLESQVMERTARLEEVLGKVIYAQEEERSRLARELHDESAQALGALSIALDRARDSIDGAQPQTMGYISEARAIVSRILEETRRLILDLRPMALDDLGLAAAIRWYAETHLGEQGIAVTVEIDQPSTRLPKHIEVSLFRVIQEAVNNITKHANASHAELRLVFRDSAASVVVTDDGQGFDVHRALGSSALSRSVGLLGMQERVRLLNGTIQFHSQPGEGTQIAIEIPTVEEHM